MCIGVSSDCRKPPGSNLTYPSRYPPTPLGTYPRGLGTCGRGYPPTPLGAYPRGLGTCGGGYPPTPLTPALSLAPTKGLGHMQVCNRLCGRRCWFPIALGYARPDPRTQAAARVCDLW